MRGMFVDLTPERRAGLRRAGRPRTAICTPARTPRTRRRIVEAAAFRDGIVIAQVNEIVETELPRVDIPGSWVDFVVAGRQAVLQSSRCSRATRASSATVQILMAMMAIRGIYERHGVKSLNHGIGFNTAAIELLLPTYGEKLGPARARSAATGR